MARVEASRWPAWLLPAAILLAFFALDPLNLALPVMGAIDDLVILPLALRALLSALPQRLGTRPPRTACAYRGCSLP